MDSKYFNTCYGKCRCCMTVGNHRVLSEEYYHHGIREVYVDIFMECFNITLSTSDNLTNLICGECVSRLRDASAFRMQVLSADQQLHDALEAHTVMIDAVMDSVLMVKNEPVEVKTENDDDDFHDTAADDSHVSDQLTKRTRTELVGGEAEMLSRFPPGTLRRLPRRKDLRNYCNTYLRRLNVLKGKLIKAKTIQKTMDSTPPLSKTGRNIFLTEKLALIHNACAILENSNITPFKTRTRCGFPCFYCKIVFENLQTLKDHQDKSHTKTQIRSVLRKYGADELVVYADVTDLKCTECNENMPNLNELKSHLNKTHKKNFYMDYTERIVPYKLAIDHIYDCQVCGFKFETFGAIERHMNTHFRNYVCEECGTGYVTKHRLKIHIYGVHMGGSFPCKLCNKVYSTLQKYKNHVDAIHKMVKRNKCSKCPERFADYFERQRHMVEVHGETPLLYKCNVCDRNFNRRYALSCHMKRNHLEQKDFECGLCPYKCFTRGELRMHMIKHNGERLFECAVCKKSYARKKTLTEHMKIHNNDRRFICPVCSQAFVQNCSLKGHMKTHHMDYLNSLCDR